MRSYVANPGRVACLSFSKTFLVIFLSWGGACVGDVYFFVGAVMASSFRARNRERSGVYRAAKPMCNVEVRGDFSFI